MNQQRSDVFVLIMAGGVGSRFWPASREDRPKQFLDILGTGKSLIQMTFARFNKWVPASQIYVVTNEKYRRQVKKHLPELSNEQIIGEPSRNNTAPCTAYASMKLYNLNKDAVCVVTPSDHVILKEDVFIELAQKAAAFAADNDALLTLGITPTRPDTGYGYIRHDEKEVHDGIFRALKFTEKPKLKLAKRYLAEGNYLWNSGMFIWSLEAILAAFRKHASGIYDILYPGLALYNTKREKKFIQENYPKTERISLDYAIMEKAQNKYTLPADIGWSDLGTWNSLYEKLAMDEGENVVMSDYVVMEKSRGCIVRAPEDKVVVARGLKDYIVIVDDRGVLIYPKSKEQKIKNVTARINQKGWDRFL